MATFASARTFGEIILNCGNLLLCKGESGIRDEKRDNE